MKFWILVSNVCRGLQRSRIAFLGQRAGAGDAALGSGVDAPRRPGGPATAGRAAGAGPAPRDAEQLLHLPARAPPHPAALRP